MNGTLDVSPSLLSILKQNLICGRSKVLVAYILQMNTIGALHFPQNERFSKYPPHFLHDSLGTKITFKVQE